MQKIIARGAEAVLIEDDSTLIKERIKKGYRIPQIDENLRKMRTKHEANLIIEARRAGVPTPQVFDVDDFSIKMQFIDGKKVKDILDEMPELCEEIGKSIAKLHSFNIIHGDLTTSNMILYKDKIFFIDFGLGFHSNKIEDKAVDLYLLHGALTSTHKNEKLWDLILESYLKNGGDEKVIKRLSEIEKRGRYRER